jgi:hypothetical protein
MSGINAAAIERELDRREDAQDLDREITHEIGEAIGPVQPFTETYKFRCDEPTDAELAAMPPPGSGDERLIELLLAARGTATDRLEEIERGFWGDMTLMSRQAITPGPGAWTRMGSPEWLSELFPDWNKDGDADTHSAREAAP